MLWEGCRMPPVAPGDRMRGERGARPPLGLKAQPILAAGQCVPDDIMIGMIRNRLREPDSAGGFIIDGFPRTVPQAEALDVLMGELELPLRPFLFPTGQEAHAP